MSTDFREEMENDNKLSIKEIYYNKITLIQF
mgnify:CR=1 FL=1